MFEAFLRLNHEHRGLSVDITNMFNDLCRVSFMEDLFESPELLGEDFSDLAPYFDSALFGDYVNWFWVDEVASDSSKMVCIYARIGTRTFSPSGGYVIRRSAHIAKAIPPPNRVPLSVVDVRPLQRLVRN